MKILSIVIFINMRKNREPESYFKWCPVYFIFFWKKNLSIPLPLKKILCTWELDALTPEDTEITFLFLFLKIEMWEKDRRATGIKEFYWIPSKWYRSANVSVTQFSLSLCLHNQREAILIKERKMNLSGEKK